MLIFLSSSDTCSKRTLSNWSFSKSMKMRCASSRCFVSDCLIFISGDGGLKVWIQRDYFFRPPASSSQSWQRGRSWVLVLLMSHKISNLYFLYFFSLLCVVLNRWRWESNAMVRSQVKHSPRTRRCQIYIMFRINHLDPAAPTLDTFWEIFLFLKRLTRMATHRSKYASRQVSR